MKPDFDAALQQHFAAISNRDIEAFKSHLTHGETLYTVVQNGHAFTTPAETIEIHGRGFKTQTGFGRAQLFIKSSERMWLWPLSNINIAQKRIAIARHAVYWSAPGLSRSPRAR